MNLSVKKNSKFNSTNYYNKFCDRKITVMNLYMCKGTKFETLII